MQNQGGFNPGNLGMNSGIPPQQRASAGQQQQQLMPPQTISTDQMQQIVAVRNII